MKKNYIYLIISILIILIFFFLSIIYIDNKKNLVDYNYYAIFEKNDNNIIRRTYLYRTRLKKGYKYKYINTEIVLGFSEEVNKTEKKIGKGSLSKKEDIYSVINKNNSNGYVILKENKKRCSIEEFKRKY